MSNENKLRKSKEYSTKDDIDNLATTRFDDLPVKNMVLKAVIVIVAFFLFDLVTSYYFITDPLYWVGLLVSGSLIGVLFDYLPDK